MNIEELTFKQVCNCLAMMKKLVEENIIDFDIDGAFATLKYDKALEYLEKQNVEQKEKIERLNNIINELEKDIDLELYKTRANDDYNNGLFNAFRYVRDKIQTLKGDSSNE